MSDKRRYMALDLVSHEIRETLNQSLIDLESFIDNPNDKIKLRFALTYLHQVAGTLIMIEYHGAALLAKEIERLFDTIIKNHPDSDNFLEMVNTAKQCIVDLSAHIVTAIETGEESTKDLLKPLNRLRKFSGHSEEEFSLSDMFNPDIALQKAAPKGNISVNTEEFPVVVKKLRRHFQRSLLALLNNNDVAKNSILVHKLVEALQKSSRSTASEPFWSAALALTEVMQSNGKPLDLDQKKALGLIDSQFKLLEAQGVKGLTQPCDDQKFKSLLYFIATEENPSEKITALKKTYNLANALSPKQNDVRAIKSLGTDYQSLLDTTHEDIIAAQQSIVDYMAQDVDAHYIENIPAIFEELSLRFSQEPFLNLQPVCLAIADIVRRRCEATLEPKNWPEVDLVADIISSVDYFLECIKREETKNLQGILTKASEILHQLYYTNVDGQYVFQGRPDPEIPLFDETHSDAPECLSIPDDIDEDIFDIFLEEADEVIEELQTLLPVLHQNLTDDKILGDVRRAWHTLKGSSRMVGALQFGEYAWSIEHMLNEIMGMNSPLIEKHFTIVQDATEQLPNLVGALKEKSGIDPTLLSSIIHRAEHYADEMASEVLIDDEGDKPELEIDTEEALEVDEELQAIFLEEAEVHLGVFVDFLAEIDGDQNIEVSGALQRALHTLKGSSHMAGVMPVARLITPLESLIMQLSYFKLTLDEDILKLLILSADELKKILNSLKIGEIFYSDSLEPLIAELSDAQSRKKMSSEETGKNHYQALLQAAIEHLGVASEQFDVMQQSGFNESAKKKIIAAMTALSEVAEGCEVETICTFSQAVAEFYQQINADHYFVAAVSLATEAHEALDDLFDVFAAHQSPELDEVLLTRLRKQLPTDDTPIEVPNASIAQEIEQADQDILVLFVEEAKDLQTHINTLCAQWVETQIVKDNLSGLKHALHTLKGGARLAQLSSMGNAALRFERQLEQAETSDNLDADFYDQLVVSQQEVNAVIDILIGTSFNDAEEDLSIVSNVENITTNAVTEEILSELTLPSEDNDPLVRTLVHEKSPLRTSVVFHIDWHKLANEYQQADTETLAFFTEEAEELVGQLDAVLQQWHDTPQAIEHCASVKRILHTLKGGARLTELSIFGDFTHEFESMIEVREFSNGFDSEFFTQLPMYFDTLQQALDVIVQGGVLPDGKDTVHREEAGAALVPAFIGHHDPSDISLLDADLVELFVEEAEEQFETIELSLSEVHEGNSRQAIEQLKRVLHTLKGGARLAGITGIGNISHDFETFVIQSERETTFDDAFVKGIQQYQEELGESISKIKETMQRSTIEPVAENLITRQASDDLTQTAIDATQNFFEQLKKQGKNQKSEPIKISANLLENLINLAGESSIGRSRIEEQVSDINFSVDEMDGTVDRLHSQLRRLEIETEAQISFRQEQVVSEGQENFDPLEMDRYTHMQQLSKSLIESASDLDDITETIDDKMRDLETLIVQQSRLNSEMQEGLMHAQMVPFSRMVPRLKRIIRQTATELNKKVSFFVENADGEMDRSILEKMIAPLEHMLRNAVDHGIESPDIRQKKGKDTQGVITLSLAREGGEILLTLSDDGGGVNLEDVRKTAEERGLIKPGSQISDHEICQFILHPGFSTAKKVTQISGRGVGMDVVNSEIKQLGGSVEVNSTPRGSEFLIRLPFTVSVNRALMVCIGHDTLAIPLNTIEGIVRVSPFELESYYQPDASLFNYAGQSYHLRYLGSLLDSKQKVHLDRIDQPVPVVLIRSNEYSFAVQVDRLLGSQEIVVKSLGPQFSMVEGLNGATVLGDGSVVIILDMPSLIRGDISRGLSESSVDENAQDASIDQVDKTLSVMVVDDSVTVRKVTSRFLDRMGMTVILAKDGLHAINQLQEMDALPDIMLLDIEMPRMDGFEVINRIRHNDRLQHIPICMITSRTGEKHRQRALSLGANDYLGKPFQESALLKTIQSLTESVAV